MHELQVDKRDLRIARAVDVPTPPLAHGAARLRLDLFALTANNMTYAVMGDGSAGYWDFFPGPQGWGRPPAWGLATVVESRAEGVEAGTRCYGFYPVGEIVDLSPVNAGPRGFVDGSPHRAAKAPVYNRYVDTRSDPAYDPALEPEQVLVRPLFTSGWWAADRVQQARPRTVVISSASSKTALSAAYRLRGLGGAELIALTSAGNSAHVDETGLYDRVLTYQELSELPAESPAAYLDFLGDHAVTAGVHRRLGASLEMSLRIGATGWDAIASAQAPEGPSPEFLFVPHYAAGRLSSEPSLGASMLRDLREFYGDSRAFFRARRSVGIDAVVAGWARLAAGTVPPREGQVLSFR